MWRWRWHATRKPGAIVPAVRLRARQRTRRASITRNLPIPRKRSSMWTANGLKRASPSDTNGCFATTSLRWPCDAPGMTRRIVTGHDSLGRAVVLYDGLAPNVKHRPSGLVSTLLWTTDESPAVPVGGGDAADREIGIPPP